MLGAACSLPASALVFSLGDLDGQLDTGLEFTSRWALQQPAPGLVGQANGGRGAAQTGDDGRLNFARGSIFSKRLTLTEHLELRHEDTGVLLGGRYWQDFALAGTHLPHREVVSAGRQRLARPAGVYLLDALLYRHYQWRAQPGLVRLGRQVVHWGESRLMGGGLDVIAPHEQAAQQSGIARPLADSALPVNLLYLSQNLSEQWLLDAFYQLGAARDVLANCGSFFSGADGLADGCRHYDVGSNMLASPELAVLQAIPAAYGLERSLGPEGIRLARGSDRRASASGQFGLALHWLGVRSRWGLYVMNYHSRQPMLGVRGASAATWAVLPAILAQSAARLGAASGSVLEQQRQAVLLGDSRYALRYPENIHLFGLSAATVLPAGWRWSGELSWRPNAPVQLNTAWLVRQLTETGSAGLHERGYRRRAVTRLQTGLQHDLGRLALEGELGYVHTGGLGHGLRYGRDPVFGLDGKGGYVTRNAWGYRLRATARYARVLPRTDLEPSLAFAHDVSGYAPDGLFSQKAKALNASLGLTYMDTYRLSLGYSAFWGGRYNLLADRDFLELDLRIRF